MKALAAVIALTALALPAVADQRPDGFGPFNPRPGPHGERSCDAMEWCELTHYLKRDATVYEVWDCDSGQIVFWPVDCDEDPLTPPCKET